MPELTARSNRDLYIAVAIGGAVGASARYGAELAVPFTGTQWPWATFLVNLSGALVLGIVLAVAEAKFRDPAASLVARRYRPFLITGILGGYTTFSTYMVEAHGLISGGAPVRAAAYIVLSVLLGVLAYLLGLFLGALIVRASGSSESVRRVESDALDAIVDEDEA